MADIIETVSFDVDVSGASKQVDNYIKTLQSLEREMMDLQKAGKDTSLTQQKIATTTAQLNKALTAETVTMKGATAQAAMYDKTQKQLNSTTQKTIQQTDNLSKSTAKQNASFGRSLAGAKNLTQAFSRGAAGLTNLVGGFGLAGAAINVLSGFLDSGISALTEYFTVSKSVAETQKSVQDATAAVSAEFVNEVRDLNALINPLKDVNTSSADRAKLIAEIQDRYPEYLKGLGDEAFSIQNVANTQKLLNDRIIDGIVLKAQDAERTKITTKLVENQVQIEKLRAAGLVDASQAAAVASKGALATTAALFGGLGEALTDADKLIRTSQFVQLEKDQKALAEENKKLDETFKNTAISLKSLNIDLGENKSVANEVLNTTEKTTKATKDGNSEREKAAKLAAEEAAENERLKGTLAGLQKELAKINELLNSGVKIEDKERLAELGAEYQRVTKDIENAQAAIDAVTKARKADEVQIIQNAKIGNLETELLRGKIAANQKLAEQLEIQRQRELNLIETNRQKNLSAIKDETARNIINAAAAKEREAFEAQSAENILRLRIKLQKQKLELAAREKEDTTEIANEVLKLEAELLELTGKQYDIKVGVDGKSVEETKDKLKEVVNQVADVVEELSGQVFDFISSQNAATLAEAEAAISKQQEVLNGLLANEAQTNTEQIRLEQERLDKLNEAREKAKENEAKIAQAQIAINLALAVARAVAEGGGVASAITVGLALTAAIFGFLKAKQTAEQAFYEGTTYATRAKGEPAGRDTIHARINEGEAVIPTDTNRQYSKAIEAIYYKKIPAKTLNAMVGDYLSGANAARENVQSAANANRREFGIVSLSRQLSQPTQATSNGNSNDTRLVAELIVSELRKLPQQQLKGSDIVTALQSKSDAKGKVRKRLGVQK